MHMQFHIALAFCASLLLSASAHAAEPINIGVVSTLTGPYAEWGTFQVNGLQLALEDIKKAGGILGRPIQLIERDEQRLRFDAGERAADALEILNRNHAITGGVRIPSE